MRTNINICVDGFLKEQAMPLIHIEMKTSLSRLIDNVFLNVIKKYRPKVYQRILEKENQKQNQEQQEQELEE